MNGNVLPEFQEFLLAHDLVNKKYIAFYAYWSSKFLAFSNGREGLTHELRVAEFLDHLGSQNNIADWQVRQAGDAVRLYFDHFLGGKVPASCTGQPKESADVPQILREMREAIRIRHYSYRTEKSYLDWVKRFFGYVMSARKTSVPLL
ncbi:MAG: hypothetical protein C4526_02785 [Nitrospiraceae bacterium]|nr:MAG: hypothetical protein C4526_02785 [Nitrospiraceae bacterium]